MLDPARPPVRDIVLRCLLDHPHEARQPAGGRRPPGSVFWGEGRRAHPATVGRYRRAPGGLPRLNLLVSCGKRNGFLMRFGWQEGRPGLEAAAKYIRKELEAVAARAGPDYRWIGLVWESKLLSSLKNIAAWRSRWLFFFFWFGIFAFASLPLLIQRYLNFIFFCFIELYGVVAFQSFCSGFTGIMVLLLSHNPLNLSVS